MKRKIIILISSIIVLFFLFLVWFDWRYSMDVIEPYEVNSMEEPHHLLIATQGSEFKNEITKRIVENLKEKPLHISVIDVTTINTIEITEWDVIVILHTWEIWEPQPDAESFLKAHYNSDKMIVMATSGDGGNMIEGVDGISGASLMEEVDERTDQLLGRINQLLNADQN